MIGTWGIPPEWAYVCVGLLEGEEAPIICAVIKGQSHKDQGFLKLSKYFFLFCLIFLIIYEDENLFPLRNGRTSLASSH